MSGGSSSEAEPVSTAPTHPPVAPPAAGAVDDAATTAARDRLVISLLLVSAFVVILNETIMSVALPVIAIDLDVTATTVQWLTTGFLLTMAIVIPVTGFLLQRFSTRAVFIAAMSLFSAGTLTAALAPGFGALLTGRIIQAGGTAIMMPLLMTTVLTLVPAASRGRVMGRVSIVIAVAPALGPTVSGFILSALDWRSVFWLVLPIALAALVLGTVRLRNVTTTRRVRVDVLSIILSAVGFGGVVYGLSSIGESSLGEVHVQPWIPIAVGVLALCAFVARQLVLQREDRALLDLRTFRQRPYVLALMLLSISMIALFGAIIVLPFYVQDVLGLEPLVTGLLVLPGGVAMGVLAPFVGRLYDRHGPRPLVVPGTILVSAAFWMLTLLTADTPVWFVLGGHVLLSVGLALIFTPAFSAGLGALPPRLYSHGSATLSTIQQVAGAGGAAVFITLMAVVSARLALDGQAGTDAIAGGIRAAFLFGAIASMLAIPVGFLLRKPENDTTDAEGESPRPSVVTPDH